MFLSIDAGNSNIVFGLYIKEKTEWVHQFRMETKKDSVLPLLEKNVSFFFLENNLRYDQVEAVGISSVVPEINRALVQFVMDKFHCRPHLINHQSYASILVSTSRPTEIGSDLMCNAVAAYGKHRQACIIVDFGTALTFTVLNDSGEIVGINIVPGLKTALKSLFRNTSQLPEVKLEFPSSAIGKDTVHSIRAGILYGYSGLVKGMLESIKKELPLDYHIVATGGLSSILTNLEGTFDHIDKNLTLEGIRLITEHNKK